MQIELCKKTDNFRISKHLSHFEFRCKCEYDHCKATLVCFRFGVIFEALRKLVGCPLHLTSGYRCPRHNHDIGGQEKSRHMLGGTGDIACPPTIEIIEFHRLARKAGFVYTYYDVKKNFVHCAI